LKKKLSCLVDQHLPQQSTLPKVLG